MSSFSYNDDISKSSIFNTLTARYEYSRNKRKNFLQCIQMQLSSKPQIICCNFLAVLQCTRNFQHSDKNELRSLSIYEITKSERSG